MFLGIEFVEVQCRLIFHSPGIESGDLVVGLVGGNIGACREFVGDDFDVFRRDPVFRQPFEVPLVIMANRGADDGLFAHQRERVGNITRCAAVFFLHAVHLKQTFRT